MKKCVRCSNKFEDIINYKGKNYCIECFNVFKKSKTQCTVCKKSIIRETEYSCDDMDKADKKKTFCTEECYNKLLQDKQDLDELDQWLKSYHKVDKLNSRIYMQIQQFKSKNGFTIKGILLTLQYITSTLKKDLELDTIGIVSWYYDTAKQEYIKKFNRQQQLERKVDNFKMFKINPNTQKVKEITDNRKSKILITYIDFDQANN